MKVADLMRTDLKTIPASATVADAIAALLQTGVSALPVVDQKERPIGVVSNQDVLRATLVSELRPWEPDLTPVVEVMSPWPPPVVADDSVSEAARLMLYLDLKRAFVIEGGAVVGVLSHSDINAAVATAKI
jgi:CBS domain-containing protein